MFCDWIGLGAFKTLRDNTVLEVGSGRGGGLSYVSSQLEPKLCVGVDFSANQVDTNYSKDFLLTNGCIIYYAYIG